MTHIMALPSPEAPLSPSSLRHMQTRAVPHYPWGSGRNENLTVTPESSFFTLTTKPGLFGHRPEAHSGLIHLQNLPHKQMAANHSPHFSLPPFPTNPRLVLCEEETQPQTQIRADNKRASR